MAGAGTIAENRFGRYRVPAGLEHRAAARAVLEGRVYELRTLEFMRAHAGRGDIVHAGTFFGDFLPALSTALAPGARLWAFEPNPESCAAACETIALNRLENVTLANAALSDKRGDVPFRTHRPKGEPLGGVSRIVGKAGKGVIGIEAMMLDDAVPPEREVSILQLDVEGHEAQALRGAYHMIRKWKPILILEAFERAPWIRRNFPDTNYTIIGTLHGNVVYAPEDRADQLSIPDAVGSSGVVRK